MSRPAHPRSAFRMGMLLFGSLLFALVLAEVVVRAAIPVRNVGPTFSEYDPVYGKRLKKNFTCTRTAAEFTMEFSTNSLGFRGPEPVSFPSGGILFLGDSFTSGYGVNDGQEFPQLIRTHLERAGLPVPVVNAGSGNTGNGYWLRFLQTDAPRFAPRLVVLAFCVNDFSDNVMDALYEIGPDGRLHARTEPPRQGNARRIQEFIEAVPGLASSHLVGLARQAFSEASAGELPPDTTTDRLTWALIDAVLAECLGLQLPALLLAIVPEGPRLAGLQSIARNHGVPVVVVPSRSQRPDLYYRVDGHWTAAGHAAIADMLLGPIIQELRGHP